MRSAMEISRPTMEETSFVVDNDYEFDVAHFFDFSRPETRLEEEEAERWFDHAPAYPPSPFATRACWGVPASLDNPEKARDLHHRQDGSPTISDAVAEGDAPVSRTDPYSDDKNPPTRGGEKLRAQVSTSRISGFMKPTASYLAKQNHSQDLSFDRILRSPTIVRDHKTSSHSSSSNDMQATKRQKLDTGYLQKINCINTRSPLQHKVAKMERKTDDWILGKPKVTVPKEFSLETARRAIRHRSKNEYTSLGQSASTLQPSESCSLNKNSSLKVPSVLRTKKTMLQLAEELKIAAAKQAPPEELFENLSIDCGSQPNSRYRFASSAYSTRETIKALCEAIS